MGKVAFRGSGRQYRKVSLKEGQERMLGACECYPKELQLRSVRGGEPLTLKQQGSLQQGTDHRSQKDYFQREFPELTWASHKKSIQVDEEQEPDLLKEEKQSPARSLGVTFSRVILLLGKNGASLMAQERWV